MTALLEPPTLAPDPGAFVTDHCPCNCHGGPGAFRPACSIPGGCHQHHAAAPADGHPDAGPSPDTPRCVAGGKPHPPATGTQLCTHHFTELGNWLREIEREAELQVFNPDRPEEWAALPSMQQVTAEDGGHGGTLASERAPARLGPLVHADPRRGDPTRSAYRRHGYSPARDELAYDPTPSAIDTLHKWAQKVRTDPARLLTERTVDVALDWWWRPAGHGPVCDGPCDHESCGQWIPVTDTVRAEPTVAGERQLLTRQLDWISEQPWAATFYRDIRRLRSALQHTNGTGGPRPLPGKCPNLIDVDGKQTECGGPLWPVKPAHTSGEDVWTGSAPSAVQCASCTERWEGAGPLARLALILEAASRTRKKAGGAA